MTSTTHLGSERATDYDGMARILRAYRGQHRSCCFTPEQLRDRTGLDLSRLREAVADAEQRGLVRVGGRHGTYGLDAHGWDSIERNAAQLLASDVLAHISQRNRERFTVEDLPADKRSDRVLLELAMDDLKGFGAIGPVNGSPWDVVEYVVQPRARLYHFSTDARMSPDEPVRDTRSRSRDADSDSFNAGDRAMPQPKKRDEKDSPPRSTAPLSLAVSRADAESKIDAAIQEGGQLRETFAALDAEGEKEDHEWRTERDAAYKAKWEGDNRSAVQAAKSWRDFTVEQLGSLFLDGRAASEFREASEPSRSMGMLSSAFCYGHGVERGVDNLVSVRRRLSIAIEPNQTRTNDPTSGRSVLLSDKVFVVHGRDPRGLRYEVENLLRRVGLSPVIMADKPHMGATTLIEKLEREGDVAFAIVVYTADDVGSLAGGALEPRARQNVVLELGYFVGRLGRRRVSLLMEPGVEMPSDFQGVGHYVLDSGGGWKAKIVQELVAGKLPGNFQGFLNP